MTDYVLGLDIGSNSVGWAAIAREGQAFEGGKRILAGVRVFPAGLNAVKDRESTEMGLGPAPAAERRQARGARRTLARKVARKLALAGILREAGILPAFPEPGKPLPDLWKTDPYVLRKRGLDEKLSLPEFGRVLYHLCQRRGFKSNRKAEKDPKDASDTEKEAGELQGLIKQADCRTLGDYLAGTDAPKRVRPGVLRRLRAMYEEEFAKLWEAQKRHHPETLTEDLRQRIFDRIFHQRPLWWHEDSIGICELTGEPRCPKGHWYGQQFRMLQEINNLSVYDRRTGVAQWLEPEQREKLAEELGKRERMTFTQMKKLLGLPRTAAFRTFEEGAGRKALDGNLVEAKLREEPLGAWYTGLPVEERDALYDLLTETETREVVSFERTGNKLKKRVVRRRYGLNRDKLRRRAMERWQLDAAQAGALARLAEGLPGDYYRYSLKAIRQLLPHLRGGLTVDKAIVEAGLTSQQHAARRESLPPVDHVIPHLTNPLVHRSLTETRKVVNALLRRLGKPGEIVIELARPMTASRRHREQIIKRQRDNEKRNAEARAEAAKLKLNPESWENRTRYKLWKEYREQSQDPAECPYCPYCGKKISGTKWASADFEIDHILPRSRFGSNSFNNLTLCCAACNKEKGSRTPFEAWGTDEDRWTAILQKIEGFSRKGHNEAKYRNFTCQLTATRDGDKLLDDNENRLLKVTQHTATAAVDYLKAIYDPEEEPVRCISGAVTGNLRSLWGLNALLGADEEARKRKDRTDHRHHAIDAMVVAQANAKHVHALCNYYKEREVRKRPSFDPPWGKFWQEAKEVIDEIGNGNRVGVSHRAQRKVAGFLHEETFYGPTSVENAYAYHKPVAALTAAAINEPSPVRGPAVLYALRRACVERGLAAEVPEGTKGAWRFGDKWYRVGKLKGTALANPPVLMPLSRKRRKAGVDAGEQHPIRRVRLTMNASRDAVRRFRNERKYVLLGSNHHAEVFRANGEWGGRVIARWDVLKTLAEQRKANRGKSKAVHEHRVVNADGKPGLRLVLHAGDMVRIGEPIVRARGRSIAAGLYCVASLSGTNKSADIELRPHTLARPPERSDRLRITRWADFAHIHKVSVDPLGRIHPCHD